MSSVDKKLEVKSRFLEVFQEENYPLEFPYKSKVHFDPSFDYYKIELFGCENRIKQRLKFWMSLL